MWEWFFTLKERFFGHYWKNCSFNLSKLISRKIWVIEKSWNFHTVCDYCEKHFYVLPWKWNVIEFTKMLIKFNSSSACDICAKRFHEKCCCQGSTLKVETLITNRALISSLKYLAILMEILILYVIEFAKS